MTQHVKLVLLEKLNSIFQKDIIKNTFEVKETLKMDQMALLQ